MREKIKGFPVRGEIRVFQIRQRIKIPLQNRSRPKLELF